MWRAGVGPSVEHLPDLSKANPLHLYKALQKASDKKPEYIDVADDFLKGLFAGIEEVGRQQRVKEMSEDDLKDKIITGIFREITRPEYTKSYRDYVSNIQTQVEE